MKKILPFILLVVGLILLLGAGFYIWQNSASLPQVNVGVDVPKSIAGLAINQVQAGDPAMAGFKQLHGVDTQLVSGIVAQYGQNAATLWVVDAGSKAQALDLIQKIDSRIAGGGSPFTPKGVFQFQNRDVYILDGQGGRTNFYVQSGSKIFWLAIGPDQAEQALKELLAFYPQ